MEKPNFEEIFLNKDELGDLLLFAKAEKFSLLCIDIETNSPIEKTAKLWGISFCFNTAQSFYIPVRDKEGRELIDAVTLRDFIVDLTEGMKLIMHNGIFDVLVLENNLGVDLTDSLYHDTILSKHLFDEERPHGLKETAVKYLGPWADMAQKELYDSIEKNGGKHTKDCMEMYKADTEVLGKYACWDVILTYLLYEIFEAKLLADDVSYRLYYTDEIMSLYKEVVIPMKRHGFPIDVEHFKKLQVTIQKEISTLEEQIQLELYEHVQDFEKSILLNPKKLKITSRSGLGKELMVKYGFTKESFPTPEFVIDNHYQDCYEYYCKKEEIKWIFNLNSNMHLAWLLFDKLGIPVVERTETGAPKTDAETIENISTDHPFAKKIIDYKKLQKLKGTYIDGILERQINGVLYASFLMFGTTSGRFSAISPNLQNMPRIKDEDDDSITPLVLKYVNTIKQGFISGKNKRIINADYSQLEPCAFAAVSGDALLQQAFKDKLDLYSSIAIEVNGLQKRYSADKKAPNYLKIHRPELRQDFKAIALGIVYGAEEYRVASLLGCTVEEAADVIRNYLGKYTDLKKYMISCDKSVLEKGYVISRFGRKRRLPEAQKLYKEFGNKLLDRRWAKQKGLSELRWKLKNALNLAKNHPIQALAGHIVNRASIAIMREFKKYKLNAYIAANVHDELTVIGDETKATQIKEIVKRCMETTTIIEVPLVAEPLIADNWKDAK